MRRFEISWTEADWVRDATGAVAGGTRASRSRATTENFVATVQWARYHKPYGIQDELQLEVARRDGRTPAGVSDGETWHCDDRPLGVVPFARAYARALTAGVRALRAAETHWAWLERDPIWRLCCDLQQLDDTAGVLPLAWHVRRGGEGDFVAAAWQGARHVRMMIRVARWLWYPTPRIVWTNDRRYPNWIERAWGGDEPLMGHAGATWLRAQVPPVTFDAVARRVACPYGAR